LRLDFKTFIRAALTIATMLFGGSLIAQNVDYHDLIKLKYEFKKTVSEVVTSQLNILGYQPKVNFGVSINLEVDEARITADLAKEELNSRKMAQNVIADLLRPKDLTKSAESKTQPDKKPQKEEDKIRFGLLNLDIESQLIEDSINGMDSYNRDSSPVNLSISLPSTVFGGGPSAGGVDVSRYLKSIKILISLPEDAPSTADAKIITSIFRELEIAKLTNQNAADTVSIERFPLPVLEAKKGPSFIEKAIDPEAGFLGTVVGAFFLGVMLLFGVIILSKVFSKVAAGISELKTAPEATANDSSALDDAAQTFEVVPAAEGLEIDAGKGFDSTSVANALTAEMRTIRDQVVDLIEGDPVAAGESLYDYFDDEVGLSNLRDLMSFIGYKALRPAISLLPESSMASLSRSIAAASEDSANLLNGVEVAQRVYRDCALKDSGSENDQVKALRNVLLGLEGTILREAATEMNAEGIALVLHVLSQKRSNNLIGSIEVDKLKDALGMLQMSVEDLLAKAGDINQAIAKAKANQPESTNEKREQLILKLVKDASIADEDRVTSLVSSDEVELFRKMLNIRFFYKDLIHVPAEHLRKVLDKLPARSRAEFLFLTDGSVKDPVLATYKEGSKLKDLLVQEMKDIEDNQERHETVAKQKEQIIRSFLSLLESRMQTNRDLFEEILAKKYGSVVRVKEDESITAAWVS